MSCRKRKVMMRTSRPLPPWPITGFLLRSTCSIMVGATLKQATTGCSYGTHTRKTPRASWMSMCSVSWKHPAVNLRAQVATLRSPAPLTGFPLARSLGWWCRCLVSKASTKLGWFPRVKQRTCTITNTFTKHTMPRGGNPKNRWMRKPWGCMGDSPGTWSNTTLDPSHATLQMEWVSPPVPLTQWVTGMRLCVFC